MGEIHCIRWHLLHLQIDCVSPAAHANFVRLTVRPILLELHLQSSQMILDAWVFKQACPAGAGSAATAAHMPAMLLHCAAELMSFIVFAAPQCTPPCPAGERIKQSIPGTNEYEATHGMTGAHRTVEQAKAHVPGEARLHATPT
jgi:hypothetical protein